MLDVAPLELAEKEGDILLATDYFYEGVLDPEATHAQLAIALDHLHESLDSATLIGYPLPADARRNNLLLGSTSRLEPPSIDM